MRMTYCYTYSVDTVVLARPGADVARGATVQVHRRVSSYIDDVDEDQDAGRKI